MLDTGDRSHKKSGQSRTPGASCLLEAAWPGLCPGPAPTLTPGNGPSVTLFLPVQDMLLGEGVEVPPFLPASALPPAQACSRGLGCCPGGAGMQPREQEPCDHGATSAAHAVLGRREMGEEHVTLRRGGGRRAKKVDGQAEREVRCQCVCPQAM